MGLEIERKFLLKSDDWRKLGHPVPYAQGYLVADQDRTVRIRVAGNVGFITIKGKSHGFSRKEYEYTVPQHEAIELLDLCALPVIRKYRTKVQYHGKTWEIDEFEGANKGLVMAEIELNSENESFAIPDWIGVEVTGDIRYYNASLAKNPYQNWAK